MPVAVHHQAEVADFAFVVVGAGTVVVRADRERLAPGSYRAFLSRLEQDVARLKLPFCQAAMYLPNVNTFSNPIDIAGAAISFARRHRELRAVYTVAPQGGLVALVVDTAMRSLPGLEQRILRDPAAAVPLLRKREPDLPFAWQDLPREHRAAA